MKLFKLPSPKDLGWSKDNALEIDLCKSSANSKTWQDYDKKMKKEHPIKFWLNKTLRQWLTVHIHFPILHHWFQFKDWWNNDHLVDLRKGGYKFNGLDAYDFFSSKILEANMAVLINYIEKYKPTIEAQDGQNLYAIYKYWTKDRSPTIDLLNILWLNYDENKTQIEILESLVKYRDTEMLKLLIDVRDSMIEIKG